MKDLKNANIAKMANDLGLSPEKIRRILFQDVYVFSTLEQANEAYACALAGSEKEKQALKKWSAFSAEEVAKVSTLEEARKAHDRAPSRSKEKKQAVDLTRDAGQRRETRGDRGAGAAWRPRSGSRNGGRG